MVRISDIYENAVAWNTVPFCDIDDADIPTYLLRPNDILFARTGGTVGKSFLVSEVPCESIILAPAEKRHNSYCTAKL